jgi:diguanylate cyclase (GGDEF)-like protein
VIFRAIIDAGVELPLYSIDYDETDSKTIQAVFNKKPLSFKDTLPVRARVGNKAFQPRSQLFLPLLNEDKVIGVLTIQSAKSNRFDGDEYNLILAIAPFIALAFGNALSHEKLKELNNLLVEDKKEIIIAQKKIEFLALHDPLTELPNRRALNQYIDSAILKIVPNKPFSLAFIDLDGFKPVNDKHGHIVGDQVLKIVAERINGVLRKSDFSSRVGGDEFVVVIDHIADPLQLEGMINRILACIEKPIGLDNKTLAFSASIGVVEYKKHGINLDTLIHQADQAMYQVKRTGKGGILIAD